MTIDVTDKSLGLASDLYEGRGLLGMQERIGALNGTVSLAGHHEVHGVRLRATFPVQDRSELGHDLEKLYPYVHRSKHGWASPRSVICALKKFEEGLA